MKKKLLPGKKQRRVPIQDLIRKHWFLVGILFAIVFASLAPSLGTKGGYLKPEYTVKYGAVSVIFLISGLTLKTDDIFNTFTHYKLHLFIQVFTFLVFPVFMYFVSTILYAVGVNHWVVKG